MSTPAEPSGGGNVFTRKMGPLPMWGWMAIAALLAVFYYLYKKNQSGSTSSGAASPSSVNTPGGVDASLVPQFVNQVYNQETPPPAPNITVNNNEPFTTGTPIVTPAKGPAYGAAGPPTKGMIPVSPSEANIITSQKNVYQASGKPQQAYMWNGTAYIPVTNGQVKDIYNYYVNAAEGTEIQKYAKAHGNNPVPANRLPQGLQKLWHSGTLEGSTVVALLRLWWLPG